MSFLCCNWLRKLPSFAESRMYIHSSDLVWLCCCRTYIHSSSDLVWLCCSFAIIGYGSSPVDSNMLGCVTSTWAYQLACFQVVRIWDGYISLKTQLSL